MLSLALMTFIPVTAQIQLWDARFDYPAIKSPNVGGKPGMFIEPYTGVFTNKFWGTHPLIGISFGVTFKRYIASFSYESRLGRSTNDYIFSYKDTVRQSAHFRNRAWMYDYTRLLLSKRRMEITLIGGVESNKIPVRKADDELRVSGVGYSAGFGYHILFSNGIGPLIQIRYHRMSLSNRMMSKYEKNSLIIRIMYTSGIKKRNLFRGLQ